MSIFTPCFLATTDLLGARRSCGQLSIDREAVDINFYSLSLLILLKPFDGGLGQPLPQRLPGVWYVRPSKPCRCRGKLLHHGRDSYVLVFS